ncbi:3-deoxy-D-manno-octulosonic acid transferase [Chitinophagaceae bacterium LB-8]|uniref:3-deoxy-D-manno-octulosonic acid transferase n=1 Tax=Paraflavisolibacter caeni TaxID=2982496 RepID=A0A9X3BF02_9BACT|nr:glycosyltransferase N-terminal domain-containing protein [Paraflavisolibacter caeni]MCU7548019.1 3-deoxy-D-manno-octulosonic acid transferase [Paraflavisolibacter caeni]
MIWIYNIFIFFYQFIVKIASFRNEKAKQWLVGRKDIWAQLEQQLPSKEPIIWIHSASTGEFEQAKPIIEQLKNSYPAYKVLVTFFSPSGYNAARKYALADYKFYLPVDTRRNAGRFLNIVRPQLVIFVKYEFWYHYLKSISSRNIPLLLVSSSFRKNQAFFKWYGGFYKKMLHFFTWIFVQDVSSLNILNQQQIIHCSISGDTRFDRVAAIEENFSEIPLVARFTANENVMVAGSTWPEDEELLETLAAQFPALKFIIAPHEINEGHIQNIQNRLPSPARFSQLKDNESNLQDYQTLIIDNIGMLSRLYKYGSIAYVGGAFKTGLHNILEAAVYGKPVIFGPNYQKFREAKELISAGGAFSITNAADLQQKISILLNDQHALAVASEAAANYVSNNKGATARIFQTIQEKRLLTR